MITPAHRRLVVADSRALCLTCWQPFARPADLARHVAAQRCAACAAIAEGEEVGKHREHIERVRAEACGAETIVSPTLCEPFELDGGRA